MFSDESSYILIRCGSNSRTCQIYLCRAVRILRNAAANSLQYQLELNSLKNQNIDITNFEEQVSDIKDRFGKNYELANRRFNKAIDEIDKSIDHLQLIKENLLSSINEFRLANNKLDDLSIRKLIKNNTTMQELFSANDK